ncbi:MAG TPA: hypothetical protein VM938_15085 [Acidimicrobiales bacterium]|nr:hypothetical protein [Acidimicrobiales bacterium]
MRRALRLLLAAVLLVGPACGGDDKEPAAVSPEDGLHFVTEFLLGIAEAGGKVAPWYRTLDEVTPNVVYVYPDGRTKRLSDLAVVGRFVGLEEGAGFVVSEDAPDGTPTRFDNPNAKWRSVHGVVEVERSVGGGEAPKQLKVSLPLYSHEDFAKFDAGLRALGRVVLLLDADSVLVRYDPSLYVVADNHVFIATVADDETLALPMFPPERATALLAPPGVRKLSELDNRARTPRKVVLTPGPHPDMPTRGPA